MVRMLGRWRDQDWRVGPRGRDLFAALSLCLLVGCDSSAPSPVPTPTPTAGSTGSPAAAGSAPSPVAPAGIRFRSITSSSGIDFRFHDGREARVYSMLESLGGGAGALDYDRDGRMDLFLAGGGGFAPGNQITGLPVGCFRNEGPGRFRAVRDLARVDSPDHYNHGIVVGDYDADGWPDFLVTGWGGVRLWHNEGDGTFDEVHLNAGLTDPLWSSSGSWGDFNRDGALDLYLAHYVNWSFANHPVCLGPRPGDRDICPPRDFSALPHVIYYGNGDGTFRDASREAGLKPDGKGLGVLTADFDLDGDLDIYVANDTTENFLYLNDGRGHFEEVGLSRGVAVDDSGTPNGSMGVDLCDFNRDGLPDIWVTNYEREAFAMYRNEGAGQFLHVSQSAGITALRGLFVGFGTVCSDFDRDGDEDMAVANGHVILFPQASPRRQQPVVLENQGSRFRRVMQVGDPFFDTDHEGRGLGTLDWDDDGDQDLVYSHLNDPVELLANESSAGHWFAVRLVGTQSDRDAIGAQVTVKFAGRELRRHRRGGGSYLSSPDPRVFFGLGEISRIDSVEVVWPSGARSVVASPPIDSFLTVVEPNDAVGSRSN